jgi:calcineurin-like phosphoesterase family protein
MHQGWFQVGSLDTFVHLGDIVFRRRREDARAFLDEHLPGERRIFIEGNHDRRTRVRTWPKWSQVVRYQNSLGMKIDGVQVMMSHRPQDLEVHLNCDVQIVIHGHTHDLGNPWRWRGNQLWVNICVEQWNYKPVPWSTIHQVWKLRTPWVDLGSKDPAELHEERRHS